MTRGTRRLIQISATACVAVFALAAPGASRAGPYAIAKIAVAGEVAPGTGGAAYANGFFSVALNDVGEVAFLDDLTGGVPTWGAFLYDGSGGQAVSLSGDAAPQTGGGSYLVPGGFPVLNDAGEISFMAAVTGGTASGGIFVATAGGADVAAVASGQTAPGAGGSFDGSLSDLNRHGLNDAGAVAFADTVSGGSASSGVFLASGGGHTAVALAGETAPDTGGGVYDGFGAPAVNSGGTVVFPAMVAGGSTSGGLFADSAGVDSLLASVGDPAPGTGGGAFTDFLYPEVNANDAVVFLSDVTGGSATGGIFRIDGGAPSAVVVENDSAPGTGGGSFTAITGLAAINDAGDIAFSAVVSGGSSEAGVFRFAAATGQIAPVVLFGEAAPDSGGATFAQFGSVDVNDAGQVALQATLSNGNTGVFLATESTPVPAAPALALVVLGAGLVGAAVASRRSLRRGRPPIW